jgi:DNA-binding response OmpR family regulator
MSMRMRTSSPFLHPNRLRNGFDLLEPCADNPLRCSRAGILHLAHKKEMEAFDRSVGRRIVRLRRKIEEDPLACA